MGGWEKKNLLSWILFLYIKADILNTLLTSKKFILTVKKLMEVYNAL